MYLKKGAALIGGIGATLGLAFLISRALAKPKLVEVQLNANPVKTAIVIDDRMEVITPKKILLKPGAHKFAAVPTTPNLHLTYGFDKWTKNSVAISYSPTAVINITSPCRITAQFIMVEAGVYPIMPELM